MHSNTLNKARDLVAAIRRELADDAAVLTRATQDLTNAQARVSAIRQAQATNGLAQKLADAERELNAAEEVAVEQINIALAGEIVKRQNTDPVANHAWIVAAIGKLRSSVRSEMDTPINQKWSVHPLIAQALALQPMPKELDRPVSELHGDGQSPWPLKRRAILAEAEQQAA